MMKKPTRNENGGTQNEKLEFYESKVNNSEDNDIVPLEVEIVKIVEEFESRCVTSSKKISKVYGLNVVRWVRRNITMETALGKTRKRK